MHANEGAPEGATTVLSEGDDIKGAATKAAAELGIPLAGIGWEIDKSWFRNDTGGMVPRDTVRIIAWARDMAELDALEDAKKWLSTLLGHMDLEGTVEAALGQNNVINVQVDVAENAGRLVGRRGRTIEAVTFLMNQSVGADHEEYSFRVDVKRQDDDRGERRDRDDRGDRDDRRDRGERRERGERRGRDRDDRGRGRDRDDRGRGRDRDDRRGRDRGERGDRSSPHEVKKLQRMAHKIIARVQRTGVSERVRKEMNAYDRRMVHMEAAEADGVATRSIGEGSYKQIEFYAVDGDGNEIFPSEE